jgi:hypothetical protein
VAGAAVALRELRGSLIFFAASEPTAALDALAHIRQNHQMWRNLQDNAVQQVVRQI